MDWLIYIPFGILAGFVTTAFGAGGGLLMVIGLSFFLDIPTVLAVTAPALLVGNLARGVSMRDDVKVGTAGVIVAGAIPGLICGAFVLTMVSAASLKVMLAIMCLLYVAVNLGKEFGGTVTPSMRVTGPMLAGAGVATGVVAASVGGGGLILAPTLRGRDLERNAFVATSSVVGAAIHIGRIFGYGAIGLASIHLFAGATVLSGGVLLGNSAGRRVLGRLNPKQFRLGLLAILSVMGLALWF